jgi:drug/metabolite transporter (DMT)-like permease
VAKGGRHDPLTNAYLLIIGGGVIALPLLAVFGMPAWASWPYLLASGGIHLGSIVLIGLAYRAADYSAIYPLMRGGAPLMTTVAAALILGEVLRPQAWLGVVVLSLGIVGLSWNALRAGRLTSRSLVIAAMAALTIVAYTLADGLGTRVAQNAASYVLAMMALTGVLVLAVALASGPSRFVSAMAASWWQALTVGGVSMLSYGTALWAMTKAPIGLVGALRETSVLFAAVIGSVALKERFGLARWLAAFAIVIGLVLIQTAPAASTETEANPGCWRRA